MVVSREDASAQCIYMEPTARQGPRPDLVPWLERFGVSNQRRRRPAR